MPRDTNEDGVKKVPVNFICQLCLDKAEMKKAVVSIFGTAAVIRGGRIGNTLNEVLTLYFYFRFCLKPRFTFPFSEFQSTCQF